MRSVEQDDRDRAMAELLKALTALVKVFTKDLEKKGKPFV